MSLNLAIPGRKKLDISGVLCDMNGTLTCDGILSAEVAKALKKLAEIVKIYVMTADTFGTAADTFALLPVELVTMEAGVPAAAAKLNFLKKLGPPKHIAIGNGYNDHLMLKEAAVGICIIGREGAHNLSLTAADLVVNSPLDALDLILRPKRLMAGMRN